MIRFELRNCRTGALESDARDWTTIEEAAVRSLEEDNVATFIVDTHVVTSTDAGIVWRNAEVNAEAMAYVLAMPRHQLPAARRTLSLFAPEPAPQLGLFG